MKDAVFLDSGFFIGFLDRSDRLHAGCVRLVDRPPRHLVTSLVVVSETYSWFLHRMGEDAARRFRLAVADLPELKLLPLDAEHHREVTRKLEVLRGHKLTYVDASSLVHLGKLGISVVWGGDRDLAVEGARVLP